MLKTLGAGFTLDSFSKMKFKEVMILRWCIICDNEAMNIKSESSSSQKFVDERGLMMLNGQEIPEELIYDDD